MDFCRGTPLFCRIFITRALSMTFVRLIAAAPAVIGSASRKRAVKTLLFERFKSFVSGCLNSYSGRNIKYAAERKAPIVTPAAAPAEIRPVPYPARDSHHAAPSPIKSFPDASIISEAADGYIFEKPW